MKKTTFLFLLLKRIGHMYIIVNILIVILEIN